VNFIDIKMHGTTIQKNQILFSTTALKELCVQKAGMFSVRQKITFKKHIMEFQLKGVVNIYDAVNIFVLTETHLIIFQSKFHQTAPRGASNEKH